MRGTNLDSLYLPKVLFVVVIALFQAGCATPAIYGKSADSVRSAIAQGEDPNRTFRAFGTPLIFASSAPRSMQGGLVSPSDPEGLLDRESAEIVNLLVDAGADPNAEHSGANGVWTPLGRAAADCRVGVVRALLARGADPLRVSVDGDGKKSALHAVAWHCPRAVESQRIAGMLLDHIERVVGRGAMLEFAGLQAQYMREQGGALSYAVWLDRRGVVAELVGRGVDVNERGSLSIDSGWTPLHWAMAMGRVELIDVLVRAGADLNIRSAQGKAPEDVIGYFVEREKLVPFIQNYLATAARVASRKDVNAYLEYMQGYSVLFMAKQLGFKASEPRFAAEPPPPGWNGLEEALKKRAALTAKPAGSAPSKTPAKPSSKPAYMTAPSAR